MQAISEYIYTVFIVSISGGVMLLLAPSGQGDGIRRAYRYLVSLAVVLALVAPLHSLFDVIPSIDTSVAAEQACELPAQSDDLFRENAVSTAERQLADTISTLYDCEASVRLTVTEEEDVLTITQATLTMESDESTVYAARTYLSRLLGCYVLTEEKDERTNIT